MAKPRPAWPPAASILKLADQEGRLEVRVTPSASADAIVLPSESGPLAIRTTAPPEDSKANDAVMRMLAKALGRPRSSLELLRGAKIGRASCRERVCQYG